MNNNFELHGYVIKIKNFLEKIQYKTTNREKKSKI
jgi:hypothetical protein